MEDLVVRLRNNDQKAFAEVYEDAFWYCSSYVTKNSGTLDDAKEVFNRAFEIFWTKILEVEFVLSCQPKVFLYGVTSRLWKKKLGRPNKLISLDNQEHEYLFKQDIDESDIYFMNEKDPDADQLLLQCMQALNEFDNTSCVELLELYYFEKKSHMEIAKAMNITPQYSKIKKGNCMKYLKAHFRKLQTK